jgi:N-methylhydantoinase A
VDVGGTFTDVVMDDGVSLVVAKVPSTPADQSKGVLKGLSRVGARPEEVERFVHGTTVATNAVLERRGARTVLVTTEGFRDILEIARQTRPKLYDLFADRPAPIVPRELVVEAGERVGADGSVLRELRDAPAVADAVRALEPEAVAVCLLFSYLRPDHERAVGRALADAGAGAPIDVSLSSSVLPVFREYERASTTALNAYVGPELQRYLGALSEELDRRGMAGEIEVMRSGGGTFNARTATGAAVHTLLSGPAAGAWGAAATGAGAGHQAVIGFDMGGTSTDVTLIDDGRPRVTSEGAIDGLPFAVPSTEVHTVGAGGGSVAWLDAGGALRVGPRSAGAEPGPACYGRGGSEPTVTDAYVALGLLDPGAPLGGVLALRPDAALEAIGGLAREIGMDVAATAEGIVRVVEAHITRALRVVSVERGRDPRRYGLLAFGGAGPLHQGRLARELGCRVVIVPRHPGVLSAMGLLAAPRSADAARTVLHQSGGPSEEELALVWSELEAEARATMARQGGPVVLELRTADCRYRGQGHEIEVAAPSAEESGSDRSLTDALEAAFARAHRQRYGYVHAGEAVEIVTLRVRVEGPAPLISSPAVHEGKGAEDALLGSRIVRLDGADRQCAVYDRDALGVGDRFRGPAVVGGVDSTCLLLDGQSAEVDRGGNLLIREVGESA